MSMITGSGSRITIPAPEIPPSHAIFSAKIKRQSKKKNQLKFIKTLDCKTLQMCAAAREPFGEARSMRHKNQRKSASMIFQSSLAARCVAIQALASVERHPTLTMPRIKGDIMAPKLSDNGPRVPPGGGGGPGRGGGGGSGGNGGGGYWYLYGGFFLLLFLAFLSYLKDHEEPGM
ncbi:unnamed protein product [Coffea canephora]|uniref:Uncharacterized protein n=2 Tax=Coffea TaxID=13442 RepID=A0A068UCY1_COFCA|nr:unnamed protein product [Coffea canephora]